jgi:hypothetical protein
MCTKTSTSKHTQIVNLHGKLGKRPGAREPLGLLIEPTMTLRSQ